MGDAKIYRVISYVADRLERIMQDRQMSEDAIRLIIIEKNRLRELAESLLPQENK